MFARSGMMLAVDPQLGLGRDPAATVGGAVATADSGPLSHRHGPLADQILGVTAALATASSCAPARAPITSRTASTSRACSPAPSGRSV